MLYHEARLNMYVIFGRATGEQTLGKIVKTNPKKAKVETCEQRGYGRGSEAGTVWGVPYSMMRPATEKEVQEAGVSVSPAKAATPVNENEIMAEINGLYTQLSPENLTCDGELSRNQIAIKYRSLQSQLQAMFRKLGRTVSEDEAFSWYLAQRKAV